MPFEATSTLKIAYEAGGPYNGLPVVLLHGWPDDVRTYDRLVPALHAAGFRTVAPYLRGFGDTSFMSKDTMRSGEIVAMAQDAIDLADALNLDKFAVIGHDWCVIRRKPPTDSDAIRPPIPTEVGHPFH